MARRNTDFSRSLRNGRGAGRFTLFVLSLLAVMVSLPILRAGAASVQDNYLAVLGEFKSATVLPDPKERAARLRQCLGKVSEVMKQDTSGALKDRCLYLTGQIHHHIYDITHDPAEQKLAIDNYRALVRTYSSSALADDAQYLVGIALMTTDPDQACLELSKVGILFPKGDMCAKAAERARQIREGMGKGNRPASPEETKAKSASTVAAATTRPNAATESPGGAFPRGVPDTDKSGVAPLKPGKSGKAAKNRLEKLQYWTGDEYTRVVLTTRGPATYDVRAFPADPGRRDPARIVLELADCAPSPKVKSRVRVMDDFLQWVLVSKTEGAKAKVVLESRSIETYRVFTMVEPSRIVIDVRGKKKAASGASMSAPAEPAEPAEPREPGPPPSTAKSGQAPSLAQQLGLGVRRIVLDPGHGGKDKGAIGRGGLYEKDITLALARELKKILETEAHCEVILTRNKDKYLSLEERTAIANAQKADLFVSIHTNAHEDVTRHGVETYHLNLTTDKDSARVAALENATSSRRIGDLEAILHDLMRNTRINESSRLAKDVQSRLCTRLKSGYDTVRDLGVKQAPFYVLMGAEMPGVLVETAFITNEKEAKRLKDKGFQQEVARGIADGVTAYMQRMKRFAGSGESS